LNPIRRSFEGCHGTGFRNPFYSSRPQSDNSGEWLLIGRIERPVSLATPLSTDPRLSVAILGLLSVFQSRSVFRSREYFLEVGVTVPSRRYVLYPVRCRVSALFLHGMPHSSLLAKLDNFDRPADVRACRSLHGSPPSPFFPAYSG